LNYHVDPQANQKNFLPFVMVL